MATPELTARILRRLLASGITSRAERLLARIHPADLGPLLADLTPEETQTVVDLLFRQHRAATTLKELPPEIFRQVIDAVGDERLAQVFGRLEIDDLVDLVHALPEERRNGILERLPEDRREELRRAELYAPSCAGRVMTTRFTAVPGKMTAQEAIDHIRASGGDDTTAVLYLYVVDEDELLQGVVPIRRLVTSPPDRPCQELMIRNPVRATVDMDQEDVAQIVARYNLLAIPVTDSSGRMMGVITVDDVIDVITAEATEDIYNLAGLSEDDRVFTPVRQSIRKRLPWMVVNLGTAFLAAWVVGLFEHTLQEWISLAVFLPVVAGMAGNGGIQALTVITRGIALGEIEFSSGLRAVAKEMVVGLVIGAVTGVLSAGYAWLWGGNAYLGAVLFLAMVVTLAIGGLVGAAVPLALKALGQDPALGSSVIVTTFTDCFGFLSFLGIGTFLLNRMG